MAKPKQKYHVIDHTDGYEIQHSFDTKAKMEAWLKDMMSEVDVEDIAETLHSNFTVIHGVKHCLDATVTPKIEIKLDPHGC